MDHDTQGFVETAGCRLAFRLRGRGHPVLFVQGVGLHGDGWSPQVDGLRADHRCLTFDNRGMGASLPIGDAPTVERMAADALALLDHHGWSSAHVVGHSLGGLVGLHLAATAPDRVRSLALLCTVARGRDATRARWPIVRLGLAAGLGTARMRRHAFLSIVMSRDALRHEDRDALAARLRPIFGHDLAEQPPVVGRQLKALRAYAADARLGVLAAVPTLVVSADEDPIAPPRFGRALADRIPGARYVEISPAAHGVTVEQAARVNALLRRHVAAAAGEPRRPAATAATT